MMQRKKRKRNEALDMTQIQQIMQRKKTVAYPCSSIANKRQEVQVGGRALCVQSFMAQFFVTKFCFDMSFVNAD